MEALFWMLVAHGLADYPLQGDWLSKAKNHTQNLVGEVIWPHALAFHCLIHSGAVMIVTGVWWLAAAEFCAHAITDYLKCAGRLTYNQDQYVHIGCKVLWAVPVAATQGGE